MAGACKMVCYLCAILRRHWLRNQDDESGPLAVVTDPIFIVRDLANCANKKASIPCSYTHCIFFISLTLADRATPCL